MAGRKSKVLFDSIDLEILEKVTNKPNLGVLELTEEIGLTHQNLKQHLEKLMRAGLIVVGEVGVGKHGKIALMTSGSFLYEDWADTLREEGEFEEAEAIEEGIKEFAIVMKYLRKVGNLDYEKEKLKEIIKELKLKKKKSKKKTKK